MKIITQKFNEISKTIINSLKNKEIKSIIGRTRLKFTYIGLDKIKFNLHNKC